jgi:hypothetical protein
MSENNKWSQPAAPPPPLFVGKKERDLVKQVNDELIEKVIGQQILYFSLDMSKTNYHNLYGEAIEKTFLNPVRVYALVDFKETDVTSEKFGIDNTFTIDVLFHKRRLVEDQDLYVRLGDFIQYDEKYWEITSVTEPRYLFGQDPHKTEIVTICRRAREGLFDAN